MNDSNNLSKYLENTYEDSKTLHNFFVSIIKSENNLLDARTKNFISLKLIKEKDNDVLSEINKDFIENLIKIEEKKKDLIESLNQKIVPSSLYILNENKKIKNDISTSSKHKLTDHNIENLKKDCLKYEKERLMNIKQSLLHLVRDELEFHALEIDKLSKLYSLINDKYPIIKLPDFAKSYNLNVDKNILRSAGYDKKYVNKMNEKKMQNTNIPINSNLNNDNNLNENHKIMNKSEISGSEISTGKKRKNKLDFDEDEFYIS